jgi:hypothetical protein
MENHIQEHQISIDRIFFQHGQETSILRESILSWLNTGFIYEIAPHRTFPELYKAYNNQIRTDKQIFLTRCTNAGIGVMYLAGVDDDSTNMWDEATKLGGHIISNFVDETHPNLRLGTDHYRFNYVVLSSSTSLLDSVSNILAFPTPLSFPEQHRLLSNYNWSCFDPIANQQQIAAFAATSEESKQLDNQSNPQALVEIAMDSIDIVNSSDEEDSSDDEKDSSDDDYSPRTDISVFGSTPRV